VDDSKVFLGGTVLKKLQMHHPSFDKREVSQEFFHCQNQYQSKPQGSILEDFKSFISWYSSLQKKTMEIFFPGKIKKIKFDQI